MLRRANAQDADAVGDIFLRTRDLMTYLPLIPDEDRPKLGGWIVERHEVWVAEEEGTIVGFAGLDPGKLEHLYVDPDAQNRGIGAELLAEAKRLQPEGLQLWAFQKNDGARRFYERHDFHVVKLTDGGDNMEREPDVLYEWVP